MSNKIAFNMALGRAAKIESTRKSFNEDLTLDVPTQTILWADARIRELEEKLALMTEKFEDAKNGCLLAPINRPAGLGCAMAKANAEWRKAWAS